MAEAVGTAGIPSHVSGDSPVGEVFDGSPIARVERIFGDVPAWLDEPWNLFADRI